MTMLLGAHLSIAGGLHRVFHQAVRLNCTAIQMFTKNSQTWKERQPTPEEVDIFLRERDRTGITAIASHTSYLINPATPEKSKYKKSIDALKQEFIRCTALTIPFVVLHPGSHMGKGETPAISRIARAIDAVIADTPEPRPRLLLETMAGQGTGIGHTFEQLAEMMERIENKDHIGICLDTCHIFAAGYDIRTRDAMEDTLDRFDAVIGLDHLYLIHLNDSKRDLGSRVDRHEHIGKGKIGLPAFRFLMTDPKLAHIPKIIETPKGFDTEQMDEVNLERLRSFCC